MERLGAALLAALDDRQRADGTRPFDADDDRRWIEYRPEKRPGLLLAGLGTAARKAVFRLLATGLSPAAFAQTMAIIGLEEVLDRREGYRNGRHSEDYRMLVFGTPGDDRWGWRFEGHHLSVTMTVADGVISPAPLFLGANPARVDLGGRPVLRPLGVEEDLGRELLLSMTPATRDRAIVSPDAPWDIRTGVEPRARTIEPRGVARQDLRPGERALLDQLTAAYLGRLPDAVAERLHTDDLHFAWEGPPQPGLRQYYRIQGPDLLIEFDQTADGDGHAHTVLRRPRGDFGGDLLAAHHAASPHPTG
ncbi:DUF3500 domain-containing protein [Actinoplanes sp. NPDC051411]|uniref:DUF3500 domain-containing protein n=1 Tax=Actinoplanes sp. NPDC051411 TaxID=3155522 RepID=UPI00344A0016